HPPATPPRALQSTHLLPSSSDAPAPPATYTLSLHDALPISFRQEHVLDRPVEAAGAAQPGDVPAPRHDLRLGARKHPAPIERDRDRKSTRLNSSHVSISYAVFCLKKKRAPNHTAHATPRSCH